MDERRKVERRKAQPFDVVQRPRHYNLHPSGVEAIELCELLPFNVGNALKYCWRAGNKGERTEDLRKAVWYLRRYSRQEPEQLELQFGQNYETPIGRFVDLAVLVIAEEPADSLLRYFLMDLLYNAADTWPSSLADKIEAACC
jgi:hypothetical protein